MSDRFEQVGAEASASSSSSWLSNAVSEAWTVSQPFTADMRSQGCGRLEIAATTEFVAGCTALAGAVSTVAGALAIPVDAAVHTAGFDNGRTINDDVEMVKSGAEALFQAPIVAAYGVYSLFAPAEKRRR